MKRRSFIALVLACLGVKLLPKAKAAPPVGCLPCGTWAQLSPTFEFLEIASPPVYFNEVMEQDVVRMDQMGEYVRDQLAKHLWYDIRKTYFNELV